MQLQSDALGFPMVRIPEINLSVSLLPVTKTQFERFIAQPNSYSDSWYNEVLRISPRRSWRRIEEKTREGLFMTGILPSEALDFASWLGEGFDLPDVWEWRQMHKSMVQTRFTREELDAFAGHPAARFIIDSILAQVRPTTWAEMALLQGGVIEWVRAGEEFRGLGVPRTSIMPNVFNPQLDDPLSPLQNDRSPYFGFRLVCRRPNALRGTRA